MKINFKKLKNCFDQCCIIHMVYGWAVTMCNKLYINADDYKHLILPTVVFISLNAYRPKGKMVKYDTGLGKTLGNKTFCAFFFLFTIKSKPFHSEIKISFCNKKFVP